MNKENNEIQIYDTYIRMASPDELICIGIDGNEILIFAGLMRGGKLPKFLDSKYKRENENYHTLNSILESRKLSDNYELLTNAEKELLPDAYAWCKNYNNVTK
jgi:hypothetical protein